jgi:hypothetical protein
MWHIARQLNLRPSKYIVDNTDLIGALFSVPAHYTAKPLNLFGFLTSFPLARPHLQPIIAPLRAEKNPS